MLQLVPVLRKSPDKQTDKQTNKQTGQKLDQSQDIVTGNACMSSSKIVPNAITSNKLHIPVHQIRNDIIKKHFPVANHCTSL